jgi:hypothetical protein
MASASKVRTVHIVLHEGEYRVVPPAIVMAKGDTLKIVNHVHKTLKVEISDVPFGSDVPRTIGKGVRRSRGLIARRTGAFPYSISIGGLKARGLSDPMIIIDPEP